MQLQVAIGILSFLLEPKWLLHRHPSSVLLFTSDFGKSQCSSSLLAAAQGSTSSLERLQSPPEHWVQVWVPQDNDLNDLKS